MVRKKASRQHHFFFLSEITPFFSNSKSDQKQLEIDGWSAISSHRNLRWTKTVCCIEFPGANENKFTISSHFSVLTPFLCNESTNSSPRQKRLLQSRAIVLERPTFSSPVPLCSTSTRPRPHTQRFQPLIVHFEKALLYTHSLKYPCHKSYNYLLALFLW